MELKETLKNSWKYLPIGSAIAYEKELARKNEVGSNGKVLFHTVYPAIVGSFLVASLMYGTPNVTKWPQISERRERARQEYNAIVNQVIQCVDRDGVPGLSVKEINELYQRAGIDFEAPPQPDFEADFLRGVFYRPPRQEVKGPSLTKNDLERVAASCK